MLVVILVIGILMTISMGAIRTARQKAWRAKARDTARQVVQAWNIYLQENREFPEGGLQRGSSPLSDPDAYPTTRENLAVLNSGGRIYLELGEKELDIGLRDHWKRYFNFVLDNGVPPDETAYDGRVPHPAPEQRLKTDDARVLGNLIVWSVGERPPLKRDWIVQW